VGLVWVTLVDASGYIGPLTLTLAR